MACLHFSVVDKTQSSERMASEKISEKMIGRLYKANTCLSNLIFLTLIPLNYYENMHAFQDAGCVYASMEWKPLQTLGQSLGMDTPPSS